MKKEKRRRSKLLLCIDDTYHSRVALRFACSKARNASCPVEIIHIVNPADFNTFFAVADVMRQEKHQEAQGLLESFAEQAAREYGITPSLVLKEGLIGETVINMVAEDQDINMLIIGKSPDPAANKGVLSLLVYELAGKLPIPIMIIPGNLTEQQIEELT